MSKGNLQSLEDIRFIETRDVLLSKIKFDKNNPNKLSKEKQEGLDKTVSKYGFAVDPWLNDLEDGTYLVIDGEHRIKLLLDKGVKSTKCKIFKVKYVEVQMLRQIANKLRGEHDKTKDAYEFKSIFDNDDLTEFAKMIGESEEAFQIILEKEFDITFDKEEDEIPEPPKEPKSKLGDIYQLGSHRVMCGDCTDPDSCKKLFGDAEIHGLQTDPPYGIDYASKNEFLNKIDKGNRIQTGLKNDDTIMDYRKFTGDFLKLIPFASYNTVYVWMNEIRSLELRQAFEDAGIKYSQTINWVKNNHVLSRLDYHPKHEPCIYGWKGRHKFYGGSSKMSVLFYDKPLVNDIHPTMKPIELITELIRNGTKKGDNVYDAFLGSGTTLIVCEKTNRVCFGMELDCSYIDVILDRWSNYTGNEPIRVSDGKSWSEIKSS